MTFLLDVNVLIAMMDRRHVAYNDAHRWFAQEGHRSWATCPITENGLIRIVGSPRYPHGPGSPAAVADAIAGFRAFPGHQFWADDISSLTSPLIDRSQVQTPGHVTDTYLLALAVSRGGRLATLDRRLTPKAVRGGAAALHLIESSGLH